MVDEDDGDDDEDSVDNDAKENDSDIEEYKDDNEDDRKPSAIPLKGKKRVQGLG